MTATDETLDLEGKEHLEWHGCDLPVVQVFRRTSRAVCTELAASRRSRPMRGKSDHGGTSGNRFYWGYFWLIEDNWQHICHF